MKIRKQLRKINEEIGNEKFSDWLKYKLKIGEIVSRNLPYNIYRGSMYTRNTSIRTNKISNGTIMRKIL